jgi:hypothetical protein
MAGMFPCKPAFYRLCLYAFLRLGDNSGHACKRHGRGKNDSRPGSSLYRIAIILQKP